MSHKKTDFKKSDTRKNYNNKNQGGRKCPADFKKHNTFSKNSNFRKTNDTKYGAPCEVIKLGELSHLCGTLHIIKLMTEDIPYPNAFIFDKNQNRIGKVEEVFGPQKQVYAAVSVETETDEYYISSNKLIPRTRFLERSDVEKKKEKEDKKKGRHDRSGGRQDGRGRHDGRGRQDRSDRNGRHDRNGRQDRSDRNGRQDRSDRNGRQDRSDRNGRHDNNKRHKR